MGTKLPAELLAGDRLDCTRVGAAWAYALELTVAAFATDPPAAPLVLLFTDGTTVTITELDVPVEVHP